MLALIEVFIVVAVICGGLFLFVHVLTEWSGRPRRRRGGWLGSSDQTWSAGEYGSGNDGETGSDSGSSCGGGSSSCGGGGGSSSGGGSSCGGGSS